jgi:hypothetical protein
MLASVLHRTLNSDPITKIETGRSPVGTWGNGIFDDDTASDVRAEFDDAVEEGLDGGAATQRVLEAFGDAVEDIEEGPVVWLALAAAQLELGVLQDDVRERALAGMPADLARWQQAGPDEAAERKVVLDELRARLDGAAGP